MLDYIIEHFGKHIKESYVQEAIMDDNSVPENMDHWTVVIDKS